MKEIENLSNKLQAKFKEEELEFRVGATNSNKTQGLALAYIQARAIQKRLDEVVGIENWRVSYKEIKDGFIAKLELKINNEWIGKEDGAPNTDYESIKGGISSAFKRVASIWGIGRYLYEAESKWYPIEQKGKSYIFKELPKLNLKNKTEEINTNIEMLITKEDKAKNIQITFGKYKGKKLGDIISSDKEYLKYIVTNSKDIKIINACKYLMKLENVI